MLWYYAKGKPKESLELTAPTPVIIRWKERE
jgi:hypothetical protein